MLILLYKDWNLTNDETGRLWSHRLIKRHKELYDSFTLLSG